MITMSLAKRFGAGFAVIHLTAFILFIIYLHLSIDGQVRLLWTIWLPVDFPVSLLVAAGFDVIPPNDQMGSLIRTWLPYFVHGVLGTTWWFFVPIFVGAIFSRKNKRE